MKKIFLSKKISDQKKDFESKKISIKKKLFHLGLIDLA